MAASQPSSGSSDDIIALQSELSSCRAQLRECSSQKDARENELARARLDCNQLSSKLLASQQQHESMFLPAEISLKLLHNFIDREEQMHQLTASIKELQELNHEQREELQLLKPSDGKFLEGNAIFTDVEEQRVALEKELLSLKVCHSHGRFGSSSKYFLSRFNSRPSKQITTMR